VVKNASETSAASAPAGGTMRSNATIESSARTMLGEVRVRQSHVRS
jgi:hypothetical protein